MRLKAGRAREFDRLEILIGAQDPLDGTQPGPVPMIDDALRQYASRRVVSSAEVVDLLLDLRSAVVLEATPVALLADLDTR